MNPCPPSNMTDRLTREFRAQLTTTVESALRRIMFEIMSIFENSLHDHRMEVAHKGEEIAQLKIKLQRSEIRLKDSKRGGDGEEDKAAAPTDQTEREPEAFPPAPEQTFDVPEIDFEVPDDWCAPLGCETVTKQEEGVCPSIRLRQLYIPLRPLHLTKQEVDNQMSPEKKCGKRRAPSSGGHIRTRRTWAVDSQQKEAPRSPARNNAVDLRKDPMNLRGRAKGLKGTTKESPGKEQRSPLRNRREKSKSTAHQSDSTDSQYDAEGTYACRFCDKEFGTPFGYKVHLRTHLNCSGCKRKFPYPSVLKAHVVYCDKVKSLKTKAEPPSPKRPQPGEENRTAPGEKREQAPLNKPSKKDGSSRMHRCACCKKEFHTQSKLNGHACAHPDETLFDCRTCQKRFQGAQALKMHILRVHRGRAGSKEKTGGSSWTAPLDAAEDDRPRSPPAGGQLRQPVKTEPESPPAPKPPSSESPGEKEKKRYRKSLLSKWQTMGTQCDEGYACLVCQKVTRSKYMLIEHFHIHTGERPLKCDRCPAKFRCRSQLSVHRRRCGTMVQCDKCEKEFSTKVKLNKHVQRHHRNWAHFCKTCGKGFLQERRLQNHMKRHDQKDLCFGSPV